MQRREESRDPRFSQMSSVPTIPEFIDVYTTVLGDTWDKIAFKVYGNEIYLHELMASNPDHIRTIFFGSGVRIICPDILLPVDKSLPPWKRGE